MVWSTFKGMIYLWKNIETFPNVGRLCPFNLKKKLKDSKNLDVRLAITTTNST